MGCLLALCVQQRLCPPLRLLLSRPLGRRLLHALLRRLHLLRQLLLALRHVAYVTPSHVTCHITRHTSHSICHKSNITRHTSHRRTSHIICHKSNITCTHHTYDYDRRRFKDVRVRTASNAHTHISEWCAQRKCKAAYGQRERSQPFSCFAQLRRAGRRRTACSAPPIVQRE